MKLVELLLKQDLIIQLILGGRTLEFHSIVLGKEDASVYVSPYIHNGAPLELNIVEDKGVICNIFTDDPNNKQRISWKNIELTTVLWKERIVYCLKTHGFNNISNVDDRRLNDRVVINCEGTVYDENSDDGIEVIVHDISDIGISFCAPLSFTPTSSQLFVSFADTINGKGYFVKVECSIARTKEDDDQVLVGCRIVGDNKDYHIYRFMKYLASKNPKHSQGLEHFVESPQPETEAIEDSIEDVAGEKIEAGETLAGGAEVREVEVREVEVGAVGVGEAKAKEAVVGTVATREVPGKNVVGAVATRKVNVREAAEEASIAE